MNDGLEDFSTAVNSLETVIWKHVLKQTLNIAIANVTKYVFLQDFAYFVFK